MVAAITRPLARWLLARGQRSKGSLRGCSGGAGGGGCSLKGAGGDGCSLGRRRLSGHDDGGRSKSDCCSHGCDGGCWCCARSGGNAHGCTHGGCSRDALLFVEFSRLLGIGVLTVQAGQRAGQQRECSKTRTAAGSEGDARGRPTKKGEIWAQIAE